MPSKKFYKTQRRKGKTDYAKRLLLLKSRQTRLIVRITSRNVIAQLATYTPTGDVIVGMSTSANLKKFGWKGTGNSTPAGYLVGYALGKSCAAKFPSAILDIGKQTSVKQSRVYAVVKGVIDGGIAVPADESVFPTEDRISGKHIKTYAESLKKTDEKRYQSYFSAFLKKNLAPEKLPEHIAEIKAKIVM